MPTHKNVQRIKRLRKKHKPKKSERVIKMPLSDRHKDQAVGDEIKRTIKKGKHKATGKLKKHRPKRIFSTMAKKARADSITRKYRGKKKVAARKRPPRR